MLVARLQQFLTTPTEKMTRARVRFWLFFSLTLATICALLALQQAFRGEYIVDSDARQHVFWMQRFLDPELFPKDWITDYHQSVAPAGYKTLYWLMAKVGINPLLFNKLLPILLGAIASTYCFYTTLELLPIPTAGFTSVVLLNQILWTKYDLVSGTPRAFVYPLFLAFLYYLMRRSILGTSIAIALLGLFYPQPVFVCCGALVLRLVSWQKGRLQWAKKPDVLLSAIPLGAAFLVMLPYALHSSEFGPAVSAAVARVSPEFLPGGRTPFFHDNPWEFWLYGKRSGLIPHTGFALLVWVGLLLPYLLHHPKQFPLVQQVRDGVTLLGQVTIASVAMFFIAHLLLFNLHLPNRYTMHSLRIVLSLAAGVALIVLLDGAFRTGKRRLVLPAVFLWAAFLLIYPCFSGLPYHKYKQGKEAALYQFFSQQPKDTLVASLSEKANYLPTFAARSVLVSEMYAIAYHWGYYEEIRRRTLELIRAQYSPNLAEAKTAIEKYGADFWLLDRVAFTPEYLVNYDWLMQFEPTTEAIAALQQGTIPALSQLVRPCQVLETEEAIVLDASCILKSPGN